MGTPVLEKLKREIETKKQRLAALRAEREERVQEARLRHQIYAGAGSGSGEADLAWLQPREEIDDLVRRLLDTSAVDSDQQPTKGIGTLSQEQLVLAAPALSVAPLTTVIDRPPLHSSLKASAHVETYEKEVQTAAEWIESEVDDIPPSTHLAPEESLGHEHVETTIIEKNPHEKLPPVEKTPPIRILSNDERQKSEDVDDFTKFLVRSTRILARAIEDDYDIMKDYSIKKDSDLNLNEKMAEQHVHQALTLYDERWSANRAITSLDWSPVYPELVLGSYTHNASAPNQGRGVIQVWNTHAPKHAEYVLTADTDITMAKFSPFHPSYIYAGSYSGRFMVFDTRQSQSVPALQTQFTSKGHAHPIFGLDVLGTSQVHQIVTVSTDGTMCFWVPDMLSSPHEMINLQYPSTLLPSFTTAMRSAMEISPTCLAPNLADASILIIGSEEGSIYHVNRHARAANKEGIDPYIVYQGHRAPVTGLSFQPTFPKNQYERLILSCGMDWSIKLWPAATPSNSASQVQRPASTFSWSREEMVFDVAWSPTRPTVFGAVDGSGYFELWDLKQDIEMPIARILPGAEDIAPSRGLNKLAWEKTAGHRVAVGGLDGKITIFDLGDRYAGPVPPSDFEVLRRLVASSANAGTTTVLPSDESIKSPSRTGQQELEGATNMVNRVRLPPPV